jgi:hypothetical protein
LCGPNGEREVSTFIKKAQAREIAHGQDRFCARSEAKQRSSAWARVGQLSHQDGTSELLCLFRAPTRNKLMYFQHLILYLTENEGSTVSSKHAGAA